MKTGNKTEREKERRQKRGKKNVTEVDVDPLQVMKSLVTDQEIKEMIVQV